MYCKQTFAIIKDGAVIQDMVCENYTIANEVARAQCGEEAFAVESTQYPVSAGDYYKDGIFYFKDGITEIPRTPTAEEMAAEAREKNEALQQQSDTLSEILDDILLNVVPAVTESM